MASLLLLHGRQCSDWSGLWCVCDGFVGVGPRMMMVAVVVVLVGGMLLSSLSLLL